MPARDGAVLAAGSFADPAEVRAFDHGRVDVVEVAGVTVGRAVFEPGWRWSAHVQPVAGTDSCQVRHVGYVLAGRMAVQMDTGATAEAAAGDVVVIDGGHDGWVLGDEPCVLLDWGGGSAYARPPSRGPA
jgi:quercetin dioxygenase-like cupin family protein